MKARVLHQTPLPPLTEEAKSPNRCHAILARKEISGGEEEEGKLSEPPKCLYG